LTGKPGQSDLSLTALAENILRIAIAPVNAWQPEEELGVVPHPEALPLMRKRNAAIAALSWGERQITVEEDPLRVTVKDARGTLRQRIQFDTDSTAVRFEIGDAPLFGL
jgi:hypothetical protein